MLVPWMELRQKVVVEEAVVGGILAEVHKLLAGNEMDVTSDPLDT